MTTTVTVIGCPSTSSSQVPVTPPSRAHSEPREVDVHMPLPFQAAALLIFFVTVANFTVLLPTIDEYMHSLGAGSWLAGFTLSAAMAPSMALCIFTPWMVRHRYMPVLAFTALFMVIGNVMYGLGQIARTYWLLIAGQSLRGLFGSALLVFLYQDATNLCVSKQNRTSAMARFWNVGFLGMGMGPVFAAGIANVQFSIGDLDIDRYTNPGWVFAVLWLIILASLVFVPEPERIFKASEPQDLERPSPRNPYATTSHDQKSSDTLSLVWCLVATFLSSSVIAVWETSAAIITQRYFGWSVQASSLFIGATFLSGMVWGEGVKAVKHRFREADLAVAALVCILSSSFLLYWYTPGDRTQLLSVEVPYVIGSILLLNAANTNRTFSGTLVNRLAAAIGGTRLQTRVVITNSILVTAGRSLGGIAGMGTASLPGGPNWSAGLLSLLAGVSLLGLGMPKVHSGLRDA